MFTDYDSPVRAAVGGGGGGARVISLPLGQSISYRARSTLAQLWTGKYLETSFSLETLFLK